MNLQKLSDDVLDRKTFESVKSETESTLRVLHHLREIDRRRLYSKYKYKSLHDYAERRLGYPYDQACRRIQAMRLLKEIPEAEEKIASGALNLTTIGYAQTAFQAEAKKQSPLSKVEKFHFLEQLENKSTRAVQKIVAQEFGKEVLLRETVKPVSMKVSMLNLPVRDELLAKIEKLKGLLAHSHPGITTAELFEYTLDEVTKKVEQAKQTKVAAPRKSSPSDSLLANGAAVASTELYSPGHSSLTNSATATSNQTVTKSCPAGHSSRAATRYIRAVDNREVWKSNDDKCSNCSSIYALERDHKIPFAKGGKSDLTNLRLLCRSCNQRAAIENYGIDKMALYIKSPRSTYLF